MKGGTLLNFFSRSGSVGKPVKAKEAVGSTPTAEKTMPKAETDTIKEVSIASPASPAREMTSSPDTPGTGVPVAETPGREEPLEATAILSVERGPITDRAITPMTGLSPVEGPPDFSRLADDPTAKELVFETPAPPVRSSFQRRLKNYVARFLIHHVCLLKSLQ